LIQLRVTVWSLLTGAATHIQFPKHPDKGMFLVRNRDKNMKLLITSFKKKGYAYRPDGRYFVVAERHKSKDMVGVYDTEDSYKQVRVRE
jgi:hypothetical protein